MTKYVCVDSDGNLIGVDGFNNAEPFSVKPAEWHLAYFWTQYDNAEHYAAKFNFHVRAVSLFFRTNV